MARGDEKRMPEKARCLKKALSDSAGRTARVAAISHGETMD
jgi:hypothetical protein